MQMPGREYKDSSAGDSSYRYGFNGKRKDNAINGDGVDYDYGFRIYDALLGRFLSLDPLQKQYPELAPYQFASNTPIQAADLDGRESIGFMYTPAGNNNNNQPAIPMATATTASPIEIPKATPPANPPNAPKQPATTPIIDDVAPVGHNPIVGNPDPDAEAEREAREPNEFNDWLSRNGYDNAHQEGHNGPSQANGYIMQGGQGEDDNPDDHADNILGIINYHDLLAMANNRRGVVTDGLVPQIDKGKAATGTDVIKGGSDAQQEIAHPQQQKDYFPPDQSDNAKKKPSSGTVTTQKSTPPVNNKATGGHPNAPDSITIWVHTMNGVVVPPDSPANSIDPKMVVNPNK